MKRKMLISIALIIIMLLNCVMPIFSVHAVTSEEILLNSNLYSAVKKSLSNQGIVYDADDITHTISFSDSSILASITRLDLNEGNISDLTGLEAFTSVEHLELSGNKLSKESNLAALNSLSKLNYLDLSTNNIEDVAEISSLIDSLKANGTIVLSGQTVTMVNNYYVSTDEEANNQMTAEFELPQILELAGYIKSCWRTQNAIPESGSDVPPSVKTMDYYVTSENKKIEINVSDESGIGRYGLLRYEIYIYDDPTEASQANNVNKAAENILNGSKFNLYFVVTRDYNETINTPDTNLYNAVKEQLTAGQTVNKQLDSYPFAVDLNGDVIYYECTYTKIDDNTLKLKPTTSTKDEYVLDLLTGNVYIYDDTAADSKGDYYTDKFEKTEIKEVNATSGVVTTKEGYKIPYISLDSATTLYVQAYDEAKTFVINDTVLVNKITSLMLNNKQIRDLTGLQHFVGLSSNLNISHNYLDNIDPIYETEEIKSAWEVKIRDEFNKYLKNRQYGNLSSSRSSIINNMNKIEENEDKLIEARNKITTIVSSLASADSTAENYDETISKAIESIQNVTKDITGYTGDDKNKVKGYLDLMDEAQEDIEVNLDQLYIYLETLYDIYENEYRLTTILADSLNYMNLDEYEVYDEATKTSLESAKALLTAEISYIGTLEATKGLSSLDSSLIYKAFPFLEGTYNDPEDGIAQRFTKYLEENALNRVQVVSMLDSFKEINIYSEMASYCLIKRMNEDAPQDYCYNTEYLENRIKEFEYEGIDATLERAILSAIENGVSYGELYDIYKTNEDAVYKYTEPDTDVYMGKGEYLKADKINYVNTTYTKNKLIEEAKKLYKGEAAANETAMEEVVDRINLDYVIDSVNYNEILENNSKSDNELYIYNQVMSLSAKLLQGNVERYVFLPRLKVLDVSYNAPLDNLEGITVLTSLVDLNAAYCYIADVTNVNWTEITRLRNLNLSYNYISNISTLLELEKLRNLDVSNNLISGKLEITNNQYINCFEDLESLNLSGNQITDIEGLLVFLDYYTGGNYNDFLAREDTLNIDLSKQNIQMTINEPIMLNDYPTTVDIELPKIFTQLLAIDTARTGLGETSQNGRIESEGTYVTVNTRTEGEKVATVEVVAMNGAGVEVDTCVGEGTKAVIKYKVGSRSVSDITVTPSENVTAEVAGTVQFNAEVTGENLKYTSVVWSIEGNTSESTVISEDGLLTIGEDEKATNIKVTATSKDDASKVATVDVSIPSNMNLYLNVTPSESVESDLNGKVKFTADVVSEDITDKTVKWSIEGNTSESTVISDEGELTIGEDEKSESIVVVCESNQDTTKVVRIPVAIKSNVTTEPVDPIEPVDPTDPTNPTGGVALELGYNVDDEYLIDVKNKTSIEDFKEILLKDKAENYSLKFTKDGNEITPEIAATGMYVQIIDSEGNNVKDTNGNLYVYEIIVKGDLNGDGLANSLDSVLIKAMRNEVGTFTPEQTAAADINFDKEININDSRLLLYHRAEVNGYSLNYSK